MIRRRFFGLTAAVGSQTLALFALLSVGQPPRLRVLWSDFGTWIQITPAEDAIATAIWLAAVGCIIWLIGSTLLYLFARASRIPMLIRSVEWMTLPMVRRATERALGTILVAATLAAVPVGADPPPPAVVTIDDGGALLPPGVTGQLPEAPGDAFLSDGRTVPALPLPSGGDPMHDGEVSPAKVTVKSGDNLWLMCRRHLVRELGRRPTNGEIAPYWRKVIARNQPDLISRNPDLIYPGEVIEMPTF